VLATANSKIIVLVCAYLHAAVFLFSKSCLICCGPNIDTKGKANRQTHYNKKPTYLWDGVVLLWEPIDNM